MALVGEFITVMMASGRVVRARVVAIGVGLDLRPLVSWGGMKPFQAKALSAEDILTIEATVADNGSL